jgi:lauroyl/myristoyl acyltransferase
MTGSSEPVVTEGEASTRAGERAGGGLRRVAADFWLDALFFLAGRAPWVVRGTRGFFLWWAWNTSRYLRQVTRINARRILGEESSARQREALGKRVIGSFFDFVYDIGRTTRMPRRELEGQIVSGEGEEAYHRARSLGKGAIIATAHMGSFELGMCAMLRIEKQIHVVFQRDAFSRFERLRSEFRRRLGIHAAAVDDGWAMWLGLREALGRDEVVAIQADRVMPGQKGVKVPFLGGHALFPDGPARLSAITGAPIIPVFAIRQPDGRVQVHVEEALLPGGGDSDAIGQTVGRLAEMVGKYVKRYPEQWLVLQRAWCEDVENGQDCPGGQA